MPSLMVLRSPCRYTLPFSDAFARGNGAVGNCWVAGPIITAGVASGVQLKRGIGQQTVDATFDFDRNGSISFNLLWRVADTNQTASDYYYIAFVSTTTVFLSKHTGGGGETAIVSFTGTIPSSGTARIIVTDTRVTVYINGTLVLLGRYTPTGTGTSLSFQAGDSTSIKLDNVVLLAPSVTGVPQLDDFTGPNGALPSPWTTTKNNGFVIDTNRAKSNGAGDNQSTRTGGASYADVHVDAVASVLCASAACGITARWVDANNYYLVDTTPGGGVRLFKCVAGVFFNLLPGTAGTVVAGGRIGLRCIGTTISVWINDVQAVSVTDTSHSTGKTGMRADDTVARLDDHCTVPL